MTLLEMLEGIEIRELMPNELEILKNITKTENWKVGYIYKQDIRTLDADPRTPIESIDPKGGGGRGIIIVALGHKRWSERYPLLYFSGKTLIGFFAVQFDSYTGVSRFQSRFHFSYHEHKKRKFHINDDRMYIFPPFRGNIGLLNKLLNHLEDTLRKYGYGNIELKPIIFFLGFLKRRGYISGYEEDYPHRRYGKLL